MNNNQRFVGKYCEGVGNRERIEHIEDCASILNPVPNLPNISMILNVPTNTFKEGFIWGSGFWIQNSYGFISGAVPFLNPYFSLVLQNSLDLFWDRMGDGKRYGGNDKKPCGIEIFDLCAPDGALGDCVLDGGIVYKQGDNDFSESDWFYEATAVAISMQADIILRTANKSNAERYFNKMMRSVSFIEGTRSKNGLFLVGPSCNLLAPSYGAMIDPVSKKIKKCYLTGLSISYAVALKRLIEVAELIDKQDCCKELKSKFDKTVSSLELLKTDEGYYARYMEEDFTKHGIYGADKYGYFDAVCNIDAIAFDIADNDTAKKIYKKIESIEKLREFDFICNNYPSLDDTPWSYKDYDKKPYHDAGDWVDGGCWNTVEGRATLAYFRLSKHEDAFRSSYRNMKWLEDYRMDEPYCQWGANFYNYWQGESATSDLGSKETSVMIDDFASPVCMLRGILGVKFKSRAIEFNPSLPQNISWLKFKVPIYYGDKIIFISLTSNSKRTVIAYEDLPMVSEITLGEETDVKEIDYPFTAIECEIELLPDDLKVAYKKLKALFEKIKNKRDETHYLILTALESIKALSLRYVIPFDKANFRKMTETKKQEIISIYEQTARNLCQIAWSFIKNCKE